MDIDTIENDPIELLQAVKEHSLNYQEHRYAMSIILHSLKNMLDTHQKDNESLSHYTKRFKTSRDVLESHIGGPIILTKYVQSMALYDANDNDKIEACAKGSFGQLLSLLYMENSDQRKYGSLMKGLGAQQSLGNDQYPTSITKASKVLSKCPFDNTGKQPRIKDKDRNDRNDKYRGNDNKHSQSDDEPVPMSFAQMEGKCYCCGKTGHQSNTC
eukprot:scaffold13573_cov49-Attheya_sp.AAC.2